MKVMEQSAPMISVPAGVLKEFMSPANSRTPTPPANIPAANSSQTPTTSNSRTPSPSLPSSGDTASAQLEKSACNSPSVASVVNGDLSNDASTQDGELDKKDDDTQEKPVIENNKIIDEKTVVSEQICNGSGTKRPSDEEDVKKPDLKKIRVFAPVEEDGFKKGDVRIAVQEFNQDLHKESKRLKEAVRNETSDTENVNESHNITNSVQIDDVKNDTLDAPAKTLQTLTSSNTVSDIEVIPSSPRDIEVLPLVPKDKDKEALALILKDEHATQDKENKDNMKKKLQRLPRKELENMIIRLFSEKILYQTELGKMKQLCERSESTLEANRKKTAQFHKEIEDLRKVTNRLSAEHAARKGQYVPPIRIKRSVGIQAAPHIINKGILHANGSGGAIKTIAPRPSALVGTGSSPGVIRSNSVQGKQSIPPPNVTFNTQMIPTSSSGSPVSSGPVGLLTSQAVSTIGGSPSLSSPVANIGTVRPSGGQMLMVAQPGMMQTIPRAAATGVVNKSSSAVLPMAQGRVVQASLGNRVASTRPTGIGATPGTLVKVPVTGTAQLVAIPQAGQVVLLPPASGGQPATALVVSTVSSGVQSLHSMTNPAVAQSRIGPAGGSTSSGSRVVGTVVHSSTTTTSSSSSQQLRHPAPLPKTPFQQVGGITKKLPPQPTLKLSHKDKSIVLSWTMGKTDDHEAIASYQLYAYQEGTAPPSALLWKKVGSVKALELPMACTLTQFMPGHVYHFAVRAVDIKSRLGPFSEPRSIRLDK